MLLLGERIYNPLPALAPEHWEQAVGYQGAARYLGLYWSIYGDEATWNDGRRSVVGANWMAYLAVVDPLPFSSEEERVSLGASDWEATHWLLLDRETRRLYVLPVAPALTFLQDQERPVEPADPMAEAFAAGRISWEEYRDHLQAAVEQAQAEKMAWIRGRELCPHCMSGWVQASAGHFEPCPVCRGEIWIIKEQAQTAPTTAQA